MNQTLILSKSNFWFMNQIYIKQDQLLVRELEVNPPYETDGHSTSELKGRSCTYLQSTQAHHVTRLIAGIACIWLY